MTFLLGQQTPAADELYDIVVLEPIPPIWPQVFWAVLGILLLAGICVAIWYFLKRKNGNSEASALSKVKSRFVEIERGRGDLDANQFSLAISDALKNYLSEKFSDPLRYETSQEYLKRTSQLQNNLPEPARPLLANFLRESEEVKFGHTADADSKLLPLLKRADEIVNACEKVEVEKKGA
ncbi:MAG: DUF4381 family protein [Verrucomicrobiales bacterium]|nr:DUF4381 family protein [Verrucomicrobiales bacterium]